MSDERRGLLIAVVTVTGTAGVGALYPALSPGRSGLTKTSYVLIDHLRSIDKRRIRRVYGQLSSSELAGSGARLMAARLMTGRGRSSARSKGAT